MQRAATYVGMFTIGIGAAFANPQNVGRRPGAYTIHAGRNGLGVTMIVRQAGFAISIAVSRRLARDNRYGGSVRGTIPAGGHDLVYAP